ncbi:glutamate racemase [Parasphingorhabdus cellanae]|uniref:Glutamate racemase n=1 Tax=Parasphingorhabdus cellanae TaxID=2806553 RepID=A0ABX7T3Y9_9SPHN|nr:glutamate racemase [Parasphingorhabdus cellanae]QTD56290.1 glutamate racemase [Parasphingorhabdus cellanae]
MKADKTRSPGPLLFFDTGVGGLSVLREAKKLLPNAPIVYAADYAGMPYGMKSEDELSTRIPLLLGRLVERYNPMLVTIACNTASTVALDVVRSVLDISVVGTVPAVKPASQMTKTGVIGLLGTQATIRQPYVDRLATEFAPTKQLLRFGAPDLVHAAEAKLRGETPDQKIIDAAVAGLIRQRHGNDIDTVILACTHFPLVQEELQKSFVRDIQFIDGSQGIARRIAHLTAEIKWPEAPENGVFVTTGSLAELKRYRKTLNGFGLTELEVL